MMAPSTRSGRSWGLIAFIAKLKLTEFAEWYSWVHLWIYRKTREHIDNPYVCERVFQILLITRK